MRSPPHLVLYIENDPDDVFLVTRAFKKAEIKLDLRFAENGIAAVHYIEGQGRYADRSANPLPTFILLDWNMPIMSGREFLLWLRADPRWKRLPVVVLTSSDAEIDVMDAYDVGANGFLLKPKSLAQSITMSRALAQFWLDWNRTENQAFGSSDFSLGMPVSKRAERV